MKTVLLPTDKPTPETTPGSTHCLNCGNDVAGRFCSECGQSSNTKPITWNYVRQELHRISILHVERGILFTLRELLLRPGYAIRDYLHGKRVNHYRPLPLMLLLVGLYLFVQHGLGINMTKIGTEMYQTDMSRATARDKARKADISKVVTQFTGEHENLIQAATIPLLALGLWLMFRRKGYNYPELLVAQTFVSSFIVVLSFVPVLLYWVMGKSKTSLSFMLLFSFGSQIGYLIFVCLQLFRDKLRTGTIILRAIGAYIFGYFSFLLVAGLIGLFYGVYLAYTGHFDHPQPAKPTTTVQAPK